MNKRNVNANKRTKALGIISLMLLCSLAVTASSGFVTKLVESVQKTLIAKAISDSLNGTKSNVESGLNVSTPTPSPDIGKTVIQTSRRSASNGREIETPEHILWGVIFRDPEKFEKRAETARQRGKSDALWTDGFIRKTKLSLENAEIFKEKAKEYSKELLPVTERRQEIGLQYKLARESGKRLPEDLALRKELSELQEKRKELALKFRDEFHKAIDEEAFKAFEEWLKTEFVKNFHTKRYSGKDIYKAKVENGQFSLTEKSKTEDHHK